MSYYYIISSKGKSQSSFYTISASANIFKVLLPFFRSSENWEKKKRYILTAFLFLFRGEYFKVLV